MYHEPRRDMLSRGWDIVFALLKTCMVLKV